jgi:cellulose synthase operon protein YhjQ
MTVVALVSLKGGTGRTTLTALLATLLARRGERVLAVDLDPQGALGLHFGLRPGAGPDDLADGHADVPHVPFGALGLDPTAGTVDPAWLAGRIAALAPDTPDLVLLDVPAGPTPGLGAALALADAALVVLLPDAASYATLPATEAMFASARPPLYVVNQVDGRRPLCADVLAGMRRFLGDRPLYAVHADERVREALALGRTLLEEPAGSQVVADLEAIAEGLAGVRAVIAEHEHVN